MSHCTSLSDVTILSNHRQDRLHKSYTIRAPERFNPPPKSLVSGGLAPDTRIIIIIIINVVFNESYVASYFHIF